MSVLTNPRLKMSDLEIRARKGCPFAQEEMERQALKAADITRKIQKEGLSRIQAQNEAFAKGG